MKKTTSGYGNIVVALLASSVVALAGGANAQPSADEVLSDVNLPADAKQRVLNGEFVTTDLKGVSDSDLSIAIVFVVKVSPDALSRQIMSGDLIRTDSQVRASGALQGPGSLADLAALAISSDVAQKLTSAKAGETLNLSKNEIADFDKLQGGTQQSIQEQLHRMLLARFQSYQSSGLGGIASYDRGGSSTDVAGSLRKASEAAVHLKKYMPAFHKVLTDYPQATAPGMEQSFHWVSYDISGTPTFVLTHTLAAPDGDARAVVQRQYYVSTGYNAEQALAGFLPVQEGTIVVYTNHTFTDQVAGFGGSMKRNIGRRMMTSKLEEVFKAAREQEAR